MLYLSSCCFMLHSLHVALFPFCTFFHIALFSSFTFFVLYILQVTLFRVGLFFILHYFWVAFFFMLYSFRVALFSCCTLFMPHLFSCNTLFMLFLLCTLLVLHDFSCTHFVLYFFYVTLFSCWTLFMLHFFLVVPLQSILIAPFRHSGQQLYSKETPSKAFSTEICEIFKDIYFEEHLRTTTSKNFSETLSMSKPHNIGILQRMKWLSLLKSEAVVRRCSVKKVVLQIS